MSDRIPMLVLSGWLGSGKTTLVNQLLAGSDGERVVVLVNDVGAINIDAALIRRRGHDTIELTNGCVCCTIGGSLALALRDLVMVDRPPDRIVVEASGIADPIRVAAYGDRRRLRLDGIVTTIDALHAPTMAEHPTNGPMIGHQAASADLAVLTKVDVASSEQRQRAARWFADVAPSTPLLPVVDSTTGSPLDVLAILAGQAPRSDAPQPQRDAPGPLMLSTQRWKPGQIEPLQLGSAIDAMVQSSGALRSKGLLRTTDGRRWLVHTVGSSVDIVEVGTVEVGTVEVGTGEVGTGEVGAIDLEDGLVVIGAASVFGSATGR